MQFRLLHVRESRSITVMWCSMPPSFSITTQWWRRTSVNLSCSALRVTLLLACQSGLELVGTLRLIINFIMIVCIMNSQVVAARYASFNINSGKNLKNFAEDMNGKTVITFSTQVEIAFCKILQNANIHIFAMVYKKKLSLLREGTI